jgi:hypothetical protein
MASPHGGRTFGPVAAVIVALSLIVIAIPALQFLQLSLFLLVWLSPLIVLGQCATWSTGSHSPVTAHQVPTQPISEPMPALA